MYSRLDFSAPSSFRLYASRQCRARVHGLGGKNRRTCKSCAKTGPGRGYSGRPSKTFSPTFHIRDILLSLRRGISTPQGDASMKKYLFGLTIIFALTVGVPVALAQN